MLDVNELVRYQADMQQGLMRAMQESLILKMSPEEILQHLAQEAVHQSLVSVIATNEAKAFYKSLS